MTAPSPFRERLARLRKAMADTDVDVFLCDHAEMLAWLSDFTISETFYRGVVVPRVGMPTWILREIDREPCRDATWIEDIRTFHDDEDPYAVVSEVIGKTGARRLGADFQSFGFTAHSWRSLGQLLPEVEIVDLPRLSDRIRAQKDESELGHIRQAAAIADQTMAFLADSVDTGERVRDVIARASAFAISQGADDHWVGPISVSRSVASGGHSMGFLHARNDDRRLETGDVLHVELVPKFNGYSARMMRSIRLGPASKQELETMETLVSVQDSQIAAMAPGSRASDIDALVRQPLLAAGLRSDYPNITGYQLGLYAKTPRSSDTSLSFHPAADWTLADRQVFHMYVSADGLSVSETVMVTPSGGERLTKTARSLLQARSAEH